MSLIGRQFRWVGWASIGVLIVTGVLNLTHYGVGWADLVSTDFRSTRFGTRLAVKVGLIGAMVFLSALHGIVLGPWAVAHSGNGIQRAGAATGRRIVSWLAGVNLVLGVLVVAVSVQLLR